MHNVQNAMFAGRRGLRHGREARGHPPRPAHLRHHVLPGARPDERLRRAPVQGHPRLRPQPGRDAGDVPDLVERSPVRGPPDRGARPPGDRRDEDIAEIARDRRRRTSTTTSSGATTTRAAASRTRCRSCWRRGCSRDGVAARPDHRHRRRAGGGAERRSSMAGPAICCWSSATTSPAAGSRSSTSAATRRRREPEPLATPAERRGTATICRRSSELGRDADGAHADPRRARRAARPRDRGSRLAAAMRAAAAAVAGAIRAG